MLGLFLSFFLSFLFSIFFPKCFVWKLLGLIVVHAHDSRYIAHYTDKSCETSKNSVYFNIYHLTKFNYIVTMIFVWHWLKHDDFLWLLCYKCCRLSLSYNVNLQHLHVWVYYLLLNKNILLRILLFLIVYLCLK